MVAAASHVIAQAVILHLHKTGGREGATPQLGYSMRVSVVTGSMYPSAQCALRLPYIWQCQVQSPMAVLLTALTPGALLHLMDVQTHCELYAGDMSHGLDHGNGCLQILQHVRHVGTRNAQPATLRCRVAHDW